MIKLIATIFPNSVHYHNRYFINSFYIILETNRIYRNINSDTVLLDYESPYMPSFGYYIEKTNTNFK